LTAIRGRHFLFVTQLQKGTTFAFVYSGFHTGVMPSVHFFFLNINAGVLPDHIGRRSNTKFTMTTIT